ncbi:MAG: nickel pincer cofactor biosynthesis protein LarC [Acidobacteriaceae bacterium]
MNSDKSRSANPNSTQDTVRIGYLECFAGISGDMVLGALVSAGVDRNLLQHVVASLALGAELVFTDVDRAGIRSVKASVMVGDREADAPTANAEHEHPHAHEQHPHAHTHTPAPTHGPADAAVQEHNHEHSHEHAHGRTLPVIRAILAQAELTGRARQIALEAFEHLGRAEAKIHGVPLDSVHFHEVGAVDAIVDIACAAAGLDALGVDRWYCSAINVGGGSVDCAHGRFPVPAPATAELLKGMPTYSAGPQVEPGSQFEMVTPTGAALLKALGCDFTAAGAANFHSIGYGAGTRNPPKFPNTLRLSIGHLALNEPTLAMAPGTVTETIAVLECAVDDLSPQVVAYATALALERGALDVMSTAVVMKKGRLGTHITLLCREADAAAMQQLLFAETTTLGVRMRREQRVILDRQSSTVTTPLGTVRVKTGFVGGQPSNAQPEYEDCRALAETQGTPLKQVLQAAATAAQADQPPRLSNNVIGRNGSSRHEPLTQTIPDE